MSKKVICNKGFGKWKCVLQNIGGSCMKTGCSGSYMRSRTLPLISIKLGFQTLIVVRKKWDSRWFIIQ